MSGVARHGHGARPAFVVAAAAGVAAALLAAALRTMERNRDSLRPSEQG